MRTTVKLPIPFFSSLDDAGYCSVDDDYVNAFALELSNMQNNYKEIQNACKEATDRNQCESVPEYDVMGTLYKSRCK